MKQVTNYCPMCLGYVERITELEARWERMEAAARLIQPEEFGARVTSIMEWIVTTEKQKHVDRNKWPEYPEPKPAPVEAVSTSAERVEEAAGSRHDHLPGVGKKDGAE